MFNSMFQSVIQNEFNYDKTARVDMMRMYTFAKDVPQFSLLIKEAEVILNIFAVK